jgi:hypothetical protein
VLEGPAIEWPPREAATASQPTPSPGPHGGMADPFNKEPLKIGVPQKHTFASHRKEELQGDFRKGADITTGVKNLGRPPPRVNHTKQTIIITSFPSQDMSQRVGVNKTIAGNAAQ